jgi:hypothetical protein
MMDVKRLYNEDFVLWSKQQADALRAAAHGGSNLRLDWGHLAEEIEDLGTSQRSALSASPHYSAFGKARTFAGE